MRVWSRLFIGTALGLIANQAFALTGEDVWANQTAYMAAEGIEIRQTQSRDGNVLTVSDISYDIAFPFGVGSMSVRSGPQTYTENADGTVSIGYGETNTVAISASFRPDDTTEINIAANLQVVLTGNSTVASGTAADVTYVSTSDLLELTLTDVTISGAPDVQDLAVDAYISAAGSAATVQITTGAATTIRSSSTTDMTIVDYSAGMDDQFMTKSVSQQSGIAATTVLTLPAGPMDLMNISRALRDGLALEASYTSGASRSQTVTMSLGAMVSDQSTNVTAATTALRFDAAGLALSGSASGFEVLVPVMAGLPFPVNVTGAAVDYNFAFPINASDQPADLRYAISMQDLALNEELWAMADPTAALPRDPMSFKIDLAGSVKLRADLLDIDSMTRMIDAGIVPFDLQSVTINDLSASGLGASATAAGAFALDMSDMVTFDGIPRPTGQATATLTGINGLLDKLISIGLLAPADAMQGRMMMGMFARVVGTDQLQSTLEISAEGHVIANGQRIQ
jgi:hypothetical protein